jgi:hypothetical protein
MDHQVLGNIRTISEHQEISWEEITGIRYRRLGPGNLFIDQSKTRDWRPIIDQSERRDWRPKKFPEKVHRLGPIKDTSDVRGLTSDVRGREAYYRPIRTQGLKAYYRPIRTQGLEAKEISSESPSSGPDQYIIDQSERRDRQTLKEKNTGVLRHLNTQDSNTLTSKKKTSDAQDN